VADQSAMNCLKLRRATKRANKQTKLNIVPKLVACKLSIVPLQCIDMDLSISIQNNMNRLFAINYFRDGCPRGRFGIGVEP
jgi:hypothetical protein